jgi:mannose-6-phosphate isomerase
VIANPHFVLERIDLPANSKWALDADRETWLLVIEGCARIGQISASVGDAVFAEADRADLEVGPTGMSGLIAYPGPDPIMALLRESGEQMTKSAGTSAVHSAKSNEIVEART